MDEKPSDGVEKPNSSVSAIKEYNEYKKQAEIKSDPLWKYHQEKEKHETIIDFSPVRFSPEEAKIIDDLTKKAKEEGVLGLIYQTIFDLNLIEGKPSELTADLKIGYRSPEKLVNFFKKVIEEMKLLKEELELKREKMKFKLKPKPKKQTYPMALDKWLK